MNETPITPENIQIYLDGIPSYELSRVLWREIQRYYDSLAGDEDSAIERYAATWSIDCDELRAILDGGSLPSEATVKALGLVTRAVDGRCASCRQATTLINYFLL